MFTIPGIKPRKLLSLTLPFALSALLLACSDAPQASQAATTTSTAAKSAKADSSAQAKPTLTVYKRESCGCCNKWIDHMDDNGFTTVAHNHEELSALKIEKGIEPRYHSCHTALTKEGYIFEGHIPVKFVQQFLKNPPKGALGLSVPAMPLGSPGMEVGDRFTPYKVLLLKKGGEADIYAHVNKMEDQF